MILAPFDWNAAKYKALLSNIVGWIPDTPGVFKFISNIKPSEQV